MAKILAVNAGSSTLKWKLFEMPEEIELADGLIDRLGQPTSSVKVKYAGQTFRDAQPILDYQEAVVAMMTQLKDLGLVAHLHEIRGIGHRVVAGGEQYHESVVITDAVLQDIETLGAFAPLHNPVEAKYIDICRRLMPWALEVAIFDTAFHQTMPAENYLYSIPYQYYQDYGAHGTSVRYITHRAGELLGKAATRRLIVMHLGSGSSVTMGTRSGDIDASLLAYLMDKLQLTDINEMIDILNHHAGLLGLSQRSADQRDLEAAEADDPQAALALDIYANRVAKYVGSYATVLNGVDALIFTGGVGENGADMRARIMQHLTFLGATIDPEKNASRGQEVDLSAEDATVATWVIPTNEELMIVRDVYAFEASR
ncbi:acetate/propionate family kinase [Lacticaseibacillus sp. GG6-2]